MRLPYKIDRISKLTAASSKHFVASYNCTKSIALIDRMRHTKCQDELRVGEFLYLPERTWRDLKISGNASQRLFTALISYQLRPNKPGFLNQPALT
jgi:hypothetical protein